MMATSAFFCRIVVSAIIMQWISALQELAQAQLSSSCSNIDSSQSLKVQADNVTQTSESDSAPSPVKLSLLSRHQDGIICPTTANNSSSAIIVFMCETEAASDHIDLSYKLNNESSNPFYKLDSIGKYTEKNITIMGLLDFHIKLILTNKQPMKVMMLVYPQNSNLRTGDEIFVQCVVSGRDYRYTDDMNLIFSAGLPGEPIKRQIRKTAVLLRCQNISISWTPKPNHNLSEIAYFNVELMNGNRSNLTIVPTTEWNYSLSLCSYESQTYYKIVAVDKCGRCSNPVQVELAEGPGNAPNTPKPDDTDKTWQIIIAGICGMLAGILCTVTCIITYYCWHKKKHPSGSGK